MDAAFEFEGVRKRFGALNALDDVTLSIPAGAVVGLVGRNGGGKTTLLRHVVGLYLPTEGTCRALDRPTDALGPDEMNRIGITHQENRFLEWMTVEQHVRYVASFYKRWDRERERALMAQLELDLHAKVGKLSPGNAQKLGVVLATCHRPELLLLDEPVSALDPVARETFLKFLLELLGEDQNTVVIASHVLRDVERTVDWVVCLDQGRLRASAPLDALQERYARWQVSSPDGQLPAAFDEPFVLRQQSDGRQAQLVVREAAGELDAFRQWHGAEVRVQPLNLEEMFPFLLEEGA